MNKKYVKYFLISVFLAFVGLSIWYFSKPTDYTVTFESKTLPGIINQSLKLWDKSLDYSAIIENNSLENIKQTFTYNEDLYTYNWLFKTKNDSLTKVIVEITDPNSNHSDRIANIFKDTKLKKRAKKNILDFMNVLQDHLDSHDVKIVGEEASPEVYCAYLSFSTEQMLKANEMMKTYTYLSNELLKNKVELNGNPMVEITKWNKTTDSLHFNFCFPIIEKDSLPKHPNIKYKKIASKKALKAIYRGNYISSDRAWYKLLQYAQKNNLNIIPEPLEIYHNNPIAGIKDRNWKTEVYIPLQE